MRGQTYFDDTFFFGKFVHFLPLSFLTSTLIVPKLSLPKGRDTGSLFYICTPRKCWRFSNKAFELLIWFLIYVTWVTVNPFLCVLFFWLDTYFPLSNKGKIITPCSEKSINDSATTWQCLSVINWCIILLWNRPLKEYTASIITFI